jgi:hypothetical protein
LDHYEIKEFKTPTKNTKPTHKEAPENTVFFLLDQPFGNASTIGTPMTNKKEITIKAKIANRNVITITYKHS